MLRYFARKVAHLVVTLFAVVTFNFLLFHLLPGDPIALIARSQRLDADATARLRAFYGLDLSLPEQYWRYLTNLLQGNLGYSFTYNSEVGPIVAEHLGNTMLLITLSTLIVVVTGILIGVYAASRQGTRREAGIVVGALAFWSLPTFWVGMLMIFVFGVGLNLFPISGIVTANAIYPSFLAVIADVGRHLVLPTLTLALVDIAQFVLFSRNSLLEVLSEDYMVTARAKGLSPRRTLWGHGVRNALLPVVTASTLYASATVGGTIQVETIFSWPGMGKLIYDSVLRRDYPVMEACFVVFAIVVVLANFFSDLLYRSLDPRVRLS